MYTEEELHAMKLKELKGICKEWKVKQTGSKQEVVQRLVASMLSNGTLLAPIVLPDAMKCHLKKAQEGMPPATKKRKLIEPVTNPSDETSEAQHGDDENLTLPLLRIPTVEYPPGYLEFMSRMNRENRSILHRLGIPTGDENLLDLARVEFLERGRNFSQASSLELLAATKTDLRAAIFLSAVHLNDNTLESICRKHPDLQYLCVRECSSITDNGLKSIAHHCPELLGLDISHLKSVTDTGIQDLLSSLPKLRYLTIACSLGLSDRSLLDIDRHCPSLQYLEGLEGGHFTDDTLKTVARCRNILCLDCSNVNFTKDGVEALREAVPKIILRGCRFLLSMPPAPT
ncbi:F-box/LRR-repeat protein 7-like [Planoprotostelium fungivorum]|uniref:F-box/LRR-repeat protein 7-like n=1 Tax=Planoprotostelium fungivorum TaxID=1890364 RepID=A0A2P6N8L6_9EUKA|nr:F-box/LRR-repeat protein 7-like [Planoprotostelium fungivorum]